MRKFDSMLFMGNGEYSIIQIQVLRDRLEEGIVLLGGLQQPPHSSSEEMAKMAKVMYAKEQKELNAIVKDITMALLGKEVDKWKNI